MDISKSASAGSVVTYKKTLLLWLFVGGEALIIGTNWQESLSFARWFYEWLWINVAPVLDRLTGLR